MHIGSPTRRSFLKGSIGSAAMVSLAPAVPQFLLTASASAQETRDETILVVVQLSGGNDGLNTVIPYRHDIYRRGRPSLAISEQTVRKINDELGLHPSMQGFSKLLEDGLLSIIQGVGYPNPDRSHFSSMDIWHTARPRKADDQFAAHRATGWLGRYLDGQTTSGDIPALHLGDRQLPLALVGDKVRAPSIQDLDRFKLDAGGDPALQAMIAQAAAVKRSGNDLLSFLQNGTLSALQSSRQVQETLGKYQTSVKYPGSELARRLKTVAQLIDAGLHARIYYVDLDGFDTHANQAAAHASLLEDLSSAVTAFVRDLQEHHHDKRVLVMTFSEFGRRVRENASQGTDHGAAAPLFLAGGRLKPGLIGAHPSLTDLDEDDLKFSTDFRSIYAAVLKDWLNVNTTPILHDHFAPIPITA